MVDNQIKSAIDAELATKGLTKSESDNADLYVGYQVAISTEKQVNTFSSDFGYGGGWGYYGRGYGGMGSDHEHVHDKHTLCRLAAARFLRRLPRSKRSFAPSAPRLWIPKQNRKNVRRTWRRP